MRYITKPLEYNPDSGRLFRGKYIYAQSARGIIHYLGKPRPFTHAIWHIVHGRFPLPGFVIDHRNNCPLDDRLSNLQEISSKENILKGQTDKVCGCGRCLLRANRRLRKA